MLRANAQEGLYILHSDTLDIVQELTPEFVSHVHHSGFLLDGPIVLYVKGLQELNRLLQLLERQSWREIFEEIHLDCGGVRLHDETIPKEFTKIVRGGSIKRLHLYTHTSTLKFMVKLFRFVKGLEVLHITADDTITLNQPTTKIIQAIIENNKHTINDFALNGIEDKRTVSMNPTNKYQNACLWNASKYFPSAHTKTADYSEKLESNTNFCVYHFRRYDTLQKTTTLMVNQTLIDMLLIRLTGEYMKFAHITANDTGLHVTY